MGEADGDECLAAFSHPLQQQLEVRNGGRITRADLACRGRVHQIGILLHPIEDSGSLMGRNLDGQRLRSRPPGIVFKRTWDARHVFLEPQHNE